MMRLRDFMDRLRQLSTWHVAILVFLLSIPWYAIFISWTSSVDPDAFYHAKVSLLLWQHGPLTQFPWLDLTTLGQHFADQHFLFHVLEAPAVGILGWAIGFRVIAVFLLSTFTAALYICLRRLNVLSPLFWTVLAATSHPLVFRGLIGKASPLALTLFILGLTFAWTRKPWLVASVTAIYALSHGGWIYLTGSIVLLAIGELAYRIAVDDERVTRAIKDTLWKEILASGIGAFIGLLLHPNRSVIFSFLWVQVVKIGLGTPFNHVNLGSEWYPTTASAIFASSGPWAVGCLLCIAGVFLAPRLPLDRARARAAIAFAIPVAALFALTLKSRRNIEYLVPALALWLPQLWSLVDGKKLLHEAQRSYTPHTFRIIRTVILACFVILIGKNIYAAWRDLHEPRYPDNAFVESMAPIQAREKPGDRLFHSDWDEFPKLFLTNDRLKYISGLDPTFLYETNPPLSDAYKNFTWPSTTPTQAEAWNTIHDIFHARFVFIAKTDHPSLIPLLKSDSRFELLKETNDAVTFEVKE